MQYWFIGKSNIAYAVVNRCIAAAIVGWERSHLLGTFP